MIAPGPLPAGEAHIHRVDPDAELSDAFLDDVASWLAPDEAARLARMTVPRVRREYLVTRALVRTTLSRYADGVHPAAWRFAANEHGRPEIVAPATPQRLYFNLSNTFGMVACLVAATPDAGIDVEAADRPGKTVEIADRYFAPAEVAELRSLPEERRRERFFEYWTLKEAYIKARGMGLAIPLAKFAFRLARAPMAPRDVVPPGEVAIAIDPSLGDDAASWQLTQARPNERHYVATAIRVARADEAREGEGPSARTKDAAPPDAGERSGGGDGPKQPAGTSVSARAHVRVIDYELAPGELASRVGLSRPS